MDSVNMLKTILTKMQDDSDTGTVQSLLKTDRSIQDTIMAHKDAQDFLKLVNFNFEIAQDEIILVNYDAQKTKLGLDAIDIHFTSLNK